MDDHLLKHGAVSWTELMTSDPEGARRFYADLFGWETVDYPMEGFHYIVIKANGREIGGISPLPGDASDIAPFWASYVTVDDVDAVAARVLAKGGRLLRDPMDIPTIGRFCVLADPQGAVIHAISYFPR